MATKLFLRNTQVAEPNVDTGVIGATVVYDMLTTAGAAVDTDTVDTVASGTEIQWTQVGGGSTIAWITGRVPAGGFTLTTTDISAWLRESNMNANCGGRFRVYRYTPGAPATLTELGGGPFNDGVEFSTAITEMLWAGDVTDQAFAEDERIVLKLFITNVGTMGGGFTCDVQFNAANASTGDSFFNLAETVTFKAEDVVQDNVGTDTATITESAVGAAEGSPTDSLTITDTAVQAEVQDNAGTDSLTITEVAAFPFVEGVDSETVAVSESAAGAADATASDNATVSESASGIADATASETITASEVASALADLLGSDAIFLTEDAVQAAGGTEFAGTDSLAITESATANVDIFSTDSVTFSEAHELAGVLTGTDTFAVTESAVSAQPLIGKASGAASLAARMSATLAVTERLLGTAVADPRMTGEPSAD